MKKNRIGLVFAAILFLAAAPLLAGVFYRINGIIDVVDGNIVLTTDDCRVFTLDISPGTARQYDGQMVQIDAVSKDATTVEKIRVKKIRPFDKKIEIKDPQPYKNFQKPARIVRSEKDEVMVAGVRWDRKKETDEDNAAMFDWKTVRIRPDLIDRAYLIKKPFPPEWLAAHCLMLFTFKKGGLTDENGNESRGLVLTIEAYQRKDQNYSLTEGLKKTFGVIWILTTWENYASETCHFEKKKMIAYPILFNHEQNRKLLEETLRQSSVNRGGEFYHTTRNNCTNNLLILIESVAQTGLRFWALPSMIYNVRATMPTMVPKYLQGKKLIGMEYPAITADNFFADPSELFK